MPTAEPKTTQNEHVKKKSQLNIKPKLTNHNPQIQSKAIKKKNQPCTYMHTHIYLESIQSKLLATNHEFIGKKKKNQIRGKKRESKTHIRFCYTCQWMVRRQRYQKSIYKKKKSIRSLEFHGWQVVTEVGKSEWKSERLKMKGWGRERK